MTRVTLRLFTFTVSSKVSCSTPEDMLREKAWRTGDVVSAVYWFTCRALVIGMGTRFKPPMSTTALEFADRKVLFMLLVKAGTALMALRSWMERRTVIMGPSVLFVPVCWGCVPATRE